ncbi:MAG TPA: DUF4914 family protein [Levilinea sp.]|nr:DUF4914 family protein [Levilinea sp.]
MWQEFSPPAVIRQLFEAAPKVVVARTRQDLMDLTCGTADANYIEVAYDFPGQGRVIEATVARVRNGITANYLDYRQIRYIITSNQYIGAWKVGFIPQWIAREYLARRGNSKGRPEQIRPARPPLLGVCPLLDPC